MQEKTLQILKNFTILVVENDEFALNMINLGLKSYCKKLFLAKDGLEGFEMFKDNHIDMVLTDIHMPNMNGFEMIKLIQQIKPNQNFIVMTSYDSDINFIKSLKHGALNFIRKPLKILDIQSLLIFSLAKINSDRKQISKRVNVDFSNENIYIDDTPIFLSYKNHKIFWLFLYNLNNVVRYETVENYIYNNENFSKNAFQVAIKRIKQELIDINIENVAGIGYILKTSI